MNIQSILEKDTRRPKPWTGAYEWWYFDAISDDGQTEIVVIFYEGNPFSRRYINRLEGGGTARAEDYPAISIAIYQQGKTVYYSFTEVEKEAAFFGKGRPAVQIENHTMNGRAKRSAVVYELNLSEKLPSGYQLNANLTFRSPILEKRNQVFFASQTPNHQWDVIQARAQVTGRVDCSVNKKSILSVDFSGIGYHDHNRGREPLKNHFEDWYWGRFHFKCGTFIYFVMDDCNQNQKVKAWLIQDTEAVRPFDSARIEDQSKNLFGIHSARKLIFSTDEAEVMIQQARLLDNGPFYQRFSSDAFLNIPAHNLIQQSRGLSEYLNPPRIHNRLFWPLINMRIRYKMEAPHWVQRSPRLYRWTW